MCPLCSVGGQSLSVGSALEGLLSSCARKYVRKLEMCLSAEIHKAETRGPAWERCSRFDRERDHGGRPKEEAGGGPRCDATGLDGKFPGAQGGGCLSREGETVGLQSGPDSGQEDWEATGTEAVHDEGDGRRGSISGEFHRPCLTHRTGGVLVARIGASRAPRPRQIEAERFA